MKKKIAVITATRAEYGLLKPLIEELLIDENIDCKVIVTGTHLLEKYGRTIQFIEKDGIPIQYTIPIMEEEQNNQCVVIAKATTAFSEIYQVEKYDAIVVLGDRYELYGFCVPALLHRIPIIHIHGGEKTEGAVDEKIRHSITKMASIHFPSIEEYAKRIIQMGENPEFVYPVGALGIDNALKLPLLSKEELEKNLEIDFSNNIAIVTFHPVTMEGIESAKIQAREVFDTLIQLPVFSVVTMPNSDMGGDVITEIILEYAEKYPHKMKFMKSLGQLRYLSALKYASLVVGNSSSGIIETASFRIPTINIGDRQKGRFSPQNVIHCECKAEEIKKAVEKGLSVAFKEEIVDCVNPYGDGQAAVRMRKILNEIDWTDSRIVQKEFWDL